MSPYTHLTLKDRECILLGVTLHHTYQVIANQIGCSRATVSREIKRNGSRGSYSAVTAQQNYHQRRLKSRRLPINLCFDEFRSTHGSMSFICIDADTHKSVGRRV